MLKLLNLNIAQAYIKNKDYSSCVEAAGKVLKEDPQNAKALYRRGFAYAKTQ